MIWMLSFLSFSYSTFYKVVSISLNFLKKYQEKIKIQKIDHQVDTN